MEVERALDGELEFVDLERLGDVVVSAQLHRFHGGFHRGVAGDHDDGGERGQIAARFEDVEAVHVFHLDVRDNHLRHASGQGVDGACGGVEGEDLVA